jgi:allene oxide cyclase
MRMSGQNTGQITGRRALPIGFAALALGAGCLATGMATANGEPSRPLGHAAGRHHVVRINVVERATTDVVTDTGATGDSAGDVLTFANQVYDASNTRRVGDDNGSCIRTVAGAAYECAWTLTLRHGSLMVQGPFYDTRDSTLAITGGTGRYRTASGQMRLHARNAAGTAYDFHYAVVR